MASLGELTISIKANTVEFTDGAGNVVAKLRNMGDESEKVGKQMTSSMGEARGGLMLTEHLLGVPLPRHLNSLIAQIPGVGAAFATMLPVVGVLLAVEIIGKLIVKHEELARKIHESADASANMTVKLNDQTDGLVLQNLKLDDQIAKLEGKPSKNKLKEALIEAHDAVDKLASGFAADFAKIDAVIFDANTLMSHFKEMIYTDAPLALFSQSAVDIQLQSFNDAIKAMNETRTKLSEAPKGSDEETRLAAALSKNYEQLGSTAKYALKLMKDAGSDDEKTMNNLTQAVIIANHAVADLKLTEAQPAKKKEISDLTDRSKAYKDELANLRAVIHGEDEHAAAIRKLASTKAETVMAADKDEEKPKDDTGIDEKKNKEIAAAHDVYLASVAADDQTLASKKKLYAEEMKDASLDEERKKTLAIEWANDQQHHDDDVALAGAEYEKKGVMAAAAAEREKLALAKETARVQQGIYDEDMRSAISDTMLKKAAIMESERTLLAEHQTSSKRALAIEEKAVKDQVSADKAALDQRIAQLDKSDAEYLKKLQKFEEEKKKIEGKGGGEITKLEDDEKKRQTKLVTEAETKMADATSTAVNKMIFSHKSAAAAFAEMGKQMIEGAIKNTMIMIMTNDREKLSNAELAASNAMKSLPFPINIPAAAVVFAATMAFAEGGEVPGDGYGDTVPAMLTPGETVVTKALTQQVAQSQGGGSNRGHVIQHSPTYNVTTMDSRGFSAMLEKHDAEFQKHAVSTLRKLNVRAGRG